MSRRLLRALVWLASSVGGGLALGFLVGLARPRPRVMGQDRPVSAADPKGAMR